MLPINLFMQNLGGKIDKRDKMCENGEENKHLEK